MSKGRIPMEDNIKRGGTKISAKEVPRGCQREGVHKRGNKGEAKVGKGEGAKGGNAKETFSNGGYPRGWH